MTFKIEQIHHVAYRCNDAKETVEWYKKNLNMDFLMAFAENQVPSTKEPDPYMHIFLDAGNDNVLAFFELPTNPKMGRDENTPTWVQHIALRVKDRDALLKAREHLEANGVEVLGVTDHGLFHSIYFFDPNGHRIELTYNDPRADEKTAMVTEEMKQAMLDEWTKTKRAPEHTQFLHASEFKK